MKFKLSFGHRHPINTGHFAGSNPYVGSFFHHTVSFFSQIENDVSAAMGLREDLLRGIYAYGFEKPSAIQQRAIIPMSKGRDIIAQSQSGTGKTAVFCIGILQSLDMTTTDTQALILSPT